MFGLQHIQGTNRAAFTDCGTVLSLEIRRGSFASVRDERDGRRMLDEEGSSVLDRGDT
jgi:hypothetical protein